MGRGSLGSPCAQMVWLVSRRSRRRGERRAGAAALRTGDSVRRAAMRPCLSRRAAPLWQPDLLKVNDERAVSQARPTYPGGRGDLPESPKSPRPYSEITGRQGCRPFDARSFGRVTRTRGCPTATQTTGRTRGTRTWRRDAGTSCPTNTTSKQQDQCRQPAARRRRARREETLVGAPCRGPSGCRSRRPRS